MGKEAFVEAVSRKPVIWNKKQSRDRAAVDVCWKELSEQMGEDEFTLRKYWKYLRDQYAVELGKTEVIEGYKSKWVYFESLNFLRDIVTPRMSTRNKNAKRSATTSVTIEDDNDDDMQSNSTDPLASRWPTEDNENTNEPVTDEESAEPSRKRRRSVNSCEVALGQQSGKHRLKNPRQDEDDEHSHFFKSLLPHVRLIPRSRVLTFRSRLNELVEQFAYESWDTLAPNPQSSLRERRSLKLERVSS